MINSVPSIHSFKTYEKNILDYHTVQQAQQIAGEFLENTKTNYRTKHLTKLIESVHRIETNSVMETSTIHEKIKKRYDQLMSLSTSGLSGVNTGYENLNELTDGWQQGDLIIIGGRPSMGKTAFILNSILNAGKQSNVFSTLFSLEMTEGPILDRLIASNARINLMKMKHPKKLFEASDYGKYTKSMGEISNLSIDIRNENSVAEMRSVMRKNIRDNPEQKHVVFIDYLTLIAPKEQKQSRNNEVEEIARDLKKMALDLNIPVIVLSQLSRNVEQRQDKRPMMSDLRESGALEQIADIIGFLYRDDYYNKDAEATGKTELIIAKNRNGAIGKLLMKFYKLTNYFTEWR